MRILFIMLCVLLVAGGPAVAAKKSPVTDGPYRVYYQGGAILREENYRNTNLDGTVREYYENGKLKAVTNYAD